MDSKRNLILGLIAVVVLVASVLFIVREAGNPGGPRIPRGDWFYDLNTRQLFAVPSGTIPPVAAPSGPQPDGALAGVRAHVYGCGSCAQAKRYVAYLETWNEEARKEFEASRQRKPGETMIPAASEAGMFIRLPDQTEWAERGTPAANQVLTPALANRCPDNQPSQHCFPGQ